MAADVAMQEAGSAEAETGFEGMELPHWEVLSRLEKAAIGTRAADGSVSVRCSEPAGCFLHGPYLHLPRGHYRLSFSCHSGAPRLTEQPVLGVEVLVLSRFQQCWRDFTAAELADDGATLDFEVTPEHSLEGENEGRFEFRFFHLGNADLIIAAVDLEALSCNAAPPAAESRWRLLGRLQKSWIGRRRGDGCVRVWRREPPLCLLYGGWPYLRLPGGAYRLIVQVQTGSSPRPGRPALRIEVFGQSRWLSKTHLKRLLRAPETNGILQASREATSEDAAAGPIALDFAVPTELAMEAGADAPFDIRLQHLGTAALRIDAIDLVKLDDEPEPAPSLPTLQLRPRGRRKLVIIGNCQSETLRQGFARIEALNRRFDVKYHFIQLPKNLHEFAARDLETCDLVLIQDIRLWDEFPLRDAIRSGAEAVRFPLVRFSSLWPFDAWNGPGDKEAFDREAPNLTFPYLDGVLGRLRREIPDKGDRFLAYRSLEIPGVVNYRRLHELEVRRLDGMDAKFAFSIGSFILENFTKRQVFHTTVRPNWEVFSRLMQYVARSVGVREPVRLTENIDASLRDPQVPVHPKVARDLGVGWADEATRYLHRGREITWESYVRRYIEHYG